MSLTLFCTSSSVTSTAVQCSSSRGRGFTPSSVTHRWSCPHTHTITSWKEFSAHDLSPSGFLMWFVVHLYFPGHLDVWDGDSRFRVFIQHHVNELLQFRRYKWPAGQKEKCNEKLRFCPLDHAGVMGNKIITDYWQHGRTDYIFQMLVCAENPNITSH